jgi:DNA mismatch repair ATPase MutS
VKVFLMFPDRDFDIEQAEPWNGSDLIRDLQLDHILKAMAVGDNFIYRVSQAVFLSSIYGNREIVAYRQAVLKDCQKNTEIVRGLYDLASAAALNKDKSYRGTGVVNYPPAILSDAVDTLLSFLGVLKSLRDVADRESAKFESTGFNQLFFRIKDQFGDDYLKEVAEHLEELKLSGGLLIGAHLGRGSKGTNYVLHKPNQQKGWVQRVFTRGPKSYSFRVDDRDEVTARELGILKSRGLSSVANATAQSADNVLNFFLMLRTELAFYVGCLNLHNRLNEINEPICFPVPFSGEERKLAAEGIYDLSLALTMGKPVVGNDINADNRSLVIVTGANKGGKTTFLRSVGQNQVMMHSGMFVPARAFSANLCEGLFTHFKRKEDVSMESGKLDEELSRMNQIAEHLTTNSIVLCNEAFASTNEREGSEIARQIATALSEKRIKVFFVSHLYQFTHGIFEKKWDTTLFLRAERMEDGSRTFKLIEGEPLETSYGVDLYNRIMEPQVHA